LEESIREGSPAYRGITIMACAPKILNYKPGSRCTIRYDLTYPLDAEGQDGWPKTVIGKVYRHTSKAKNAYEGMAVLWHSGLSSGEVVTIA
jgi:hypothetical protein